METVLGVALIVIFGGVLWLVSEFHAIQRNRDAFEWTTKIYRKYKLNKVRW